MQSAPQGDVVDAMSRSKLPPIVAFVATVAVVVPAGWHSLEADLDLEGAQARPLRKTLTIDGAQVTVDVDRRLVRSGGQVTVTLVGTAASAREVELDVRLLATRQETRHRVASPGVLQEEHHVTVTAGPGGGRPVAVPLTAARADRRPTGFDLYDLEILPTVEDFRTSPAGDPNVVRVGVIGWVGDSMPVKIVPTRPIPSEGPFEIDVTVENVSARPLDYVFVDFGMPRFVENQFRFEPEVDYLIRPSGEVHEDAPLAVGASRVITYTITPKHAGITTFPVLAMVRGLELPESRRNGAVGTQAHTLARNLVAARPTLGTIDTITFERPARTARK
jgi:hypothetical protein